MHDTTSTPNNIPWPPLILVAGLAAGFLLGRLSPFATFYSSPPFRLVGLVVVAAGLALDVSAMIEMRRARTNILPHRPADRLVTTGIFRWSRNPIYLGNVIFVLGLSAIVENAWLVPVAALVALTTYRLAIRREEDHLRTRFFLQFDRYAARTGRWWGSGTRQ